MEHYKISRLLNDSTVPKFVKKWIEVNNLFSGQYSVNKNILFKTWRWSSNICGYSDAHFVVKRRISTNNAKKRNKRLTFRNKTPCRLWTSKTNKVFIDYADDLDIVMPMYNLLEHSENYSITSGSLWK